MTGMVERVAKAIADRHYRRKPWFGACSKDERVAWLVNEYWCQFINDARYAIAAMREPTLEMRKVSSFEVCEVEYPAMIDAALK
jgi:hypothetical protein